MLRLAVARSSRRYVSVTAGGARCSSTNSNNDSKKASPTRAGTSLRTKPSRGQKSPDAGILSGDPLSLLTQMAGDKQRDQDFLKMLEGTTEDEVPEVQPPKVAQTETELFGMPGEEDFKTLGLKYDPATLPIERRIDAGATEEEYAMTLVHGRSVHHPHFHPRTHDIPVAGIHFRSHHVPLLNLFTHFAVHAASSLGIPCSKVVPLPTQRRLWTVLRSPFAHKKSQENFERRVHKRAIKAWDADPEVIQRWIAYLRKHAMPGVGMKVTTWERIPLGIGASHIVRLDHTQVSTVDASKTIKALGQKIIAEESNAAQPSV